MFIISHRWYFEKMYAGDISIFSQYRMFICYVFKYFHLVEISIAEFENTSRNIPKYNKHTFEISQLYFQNSTNVAYFKNIWYFENIFTPWLTFLLEMLRSLLKFEYTSGIILEYNRYIFGISQIYRKYLKLSQV